MRPAALSERLRTVASMVTPGMRVCDVGCDHGFVSIWLVEQKISLHVLAMDVREGPLGAAGRHVAERGLESRIETRLSDGLHNYEIGEAESLICAGMGGRLMIRILGDEKAKTDSFRELILQPQSEIEAFRGWLREHGYRITEEKMVEEDGKFYPMMRAVPAGEKLGLNIQIDPEDRKSRSRVRFGLEDVEFREFAARIGSDGIGEEMLRKLSDRYGGFLLIRSDAVLRNFLQKEESIYMQILGQLQAQGLSHDRRRRRYAEVEALLRECRMAERIAAYNACDAVEPTKDSLR